MLFGKKTRLIRRILVVEDEPLVAFDNEYLLADAGYEVVGTVDSLADATRLIDAEPLDLVLSDIKLSGDDNGLDVARAAGAKGIPVLFVTGNCPMEAHELAVGCLSKPYSDRMLKAALEALDQSLQGRRLKKVPAGLSLYERA